MRGRRASHSEKYSPVHNFQASAIPHRAGNHPVYAPNFRSGDVTGQSASKILVPYVQRLSSSTLGGRYASIATPVTIFRTASAVTPRLDQLFLHSFLHRSRRTCRFSLASSRSSTRPDIFRSISLIGRIGKNTTTR